MADRRGRLRLVALALAIVASLVIARTTGATDALTAEGIRSLVARAGALGVVAFLALFVVGELVHVPGLVFVGAAVALWGPVAGGAIGVVGALLSLVTTFAVVRGVGGKPLGEIKLAFARRLLAGLERRPIATVALLRATLILSPPVTYALALSPIGFRDYLVGSAIGIVPPLSIAVVVFARVAG
jgi:uncharacterized membrane protein YdjX (TVP38/TMEM64 family)